MSHPDPDPRVATFVDAELLRKADRKIRALKKRLREVTAERDALLTACETARREIAAGSPFVASSDLKCAILAVERRSAP